MAHSPFSGPFQTFTPFTFSFLSVSAFSPCMVPFQTSGSFQSLPNIFTGLFSEMQSALPCSPRSKTAGSHTKVPSSSTRRGRNRGPRSETVCSRVTQMAPSGLCCAYPPAGPALPAPQNPGSLLLGSTERKYFPPLFLFLNFYFCLMCDKISQIKDINYFIGNKV